MGFAQKTLGEATDVSLQLRARGTSRWAVAERKEEIGCDDAWRVVDELGRRRFGCSNRQQGDPSGGNPDLGASGVTIAEASAVSRLTVAALIVVRVSGLRACCAMSGCHRPV